MQNKQVLEETEKTDSDNFEYKTVTKIRNYL